MAQLIDTDLESGSLKSNKHLLINKHGLGDHGQSPLKMIPTEGEGKNEVCLFHPVFEHVKYICFH